MCSPHQQHHSIGVKIDNFGDIYKLSDKYFTTIHIRYHRLPNSSKRCRSSSNCFFSFPNEGLEEVGKLPSVIKEERNVQQQQDL